MDPTPFGKYYLLERVNVGGMAEVFKAKDFGVEGFSRIIAIKRILPNMAEDEEFINMFIDEARITVQLNHANVVQIYELGKFSNSYYIAMEYISGRDLRQILDRFRKAKELMPLPMSAFIISKICEGLDYAHRITDPMGKPLNLVHRDISPQNILISYEGAVKVTDFGIAKAEDRASKTQAGVLKGKFGYMSPEQVRGLDIDHRSDIFAVGVLFYEMVTGKRLFIGESDFSTLEKVRNAVIEMPREVNPDIPEELETILMKALAKERDERYQWASDFAEDLQQFLITDNSIFTAKRLAGYLKETYSEEIEREMSRMEAFAKVEPPANFVQEANNHGAAAGEFSEQKTVIFESADYDQLDSGETQIETSGSALNPNQAPGSGMIGSQASMPGQASGQFYPGTHPGFQYPQPPGQNKVLIYGLIGFGSLLILGLFGVLIYFILNPQGSRDKYASLHVSTEPAGLPVAVYVDDNIVANQTPFMTGELKQGKHIITLKAPGYQDAKYEINAFPGVPLALKHRMIPKSESKRPAISEHLGSTDPPIEIGKTASNNRTSLEVNSIPDGANVYINNVNRGITPMVIPGLKPNSTYTVDIAKRGYKRERRNIAFPPEGGMQTISINLQIDNTPPVKKPSRPTKTKSNKPKHTPKPAAVKGNGFLLVNVPGKAGTKIFINGKNTGKTTPQLNLKVPAGKITIKLVTPDGASKVIKKTVAPNAKLKVIERF